ncbi:hypothetical protein ZHAS_00002113 [Anopheles sinensis]|uniref:Uncharacterized protein n=1 Tax=Anopheles sinensis TaxID=74873 RepID=A0A084VBT1_ANOSI|nr:hypothetical protein ZHAS_00002113 [Anopheles sinensis]
MISKRSRRRLGLPRRATVTTDNRLSSSSHRKSGKNVHMNGPSRIERHRSPATSTNRSSGTNYSHSRAVVTSARNANRRLSAIGNTPITDWPPSAVAIAFPRSPGWNVAPCFALAGRAQSWLAQTRTSGKRSR